MTKRILMIAGPNGAGKTTTAQSFLNSQAIDEFINADEIAKALAPLHPESMSLTASKLMLKRFHELLRLEVSFAFETTAAGTNYLKHLKSAKFLGYEINIMFLWLSNVELAIKRVAHRVAQGGHHIPEDVIKRRYNSGIKNLIKHYLPITDTALIIDNSIEDSQKIIACKSAKQNLRVEDDIAWEIIQRKAHG